jgi:hypothetical protein
MLKKMDKIEVQYGQIDFKALLDFSIVYIQNEEKMYGPVYGRMAKRYAMQFVAKRLGEKPPEGSEDWDWSRIKEYLNKNLERYPYIFNALLYAMGKTEATLQGATGTSRITAAKVANQLGFNQPSEVSDIVEVWKQTVDAWVSFKVMPPDTSYSVEDENTIKYVVHDCPYKDSCDAFLAEKITNRDGSPICGIGRGLSSVMGQKIVTGCDYILDELRNPKCIVRIVKIL